jgi:mRNA-degrading endonuclease HigB of HigAB toxin-antitoxin module
MSRKGGFKRNSPSNRATNVISESTCTHVLEDHVVYDTERNGYRILLRCRCNKRKVNIRKIFECHADAHNASSDMNLSLYYK